MKSIILYTVAIVPLLVGGCLGIELPKEAHALAIASVQSVSGTLLTVLGVWLAVMNPSAITKIFQTQSRFNTSQLEDDQVESLLTPLLVVLLVVSVAFVMSMTLILAGGVKWPHWVSVIAKFSSGLILFGCTGSVLYGIYQCVIPIVALAGKISSRRGVREGVDGVPDNISEDEN